LNKIVLITVISISTLLTGCGTTQTAHQNTPTTTTAPVVVTTDQATSVPSLTAQTKDQPYSITSATFSEDNIKIQYPQIKGLGDDSKEKAINDLIKNDVLNSPVEGPIKVYRDVTNNKVKLTLDLKYQVTLNTTELLSVVYTGYSNIEGSAHPTGDIYALTIDLENATKLKLSDFTTIDTNLAQKIKRSTAVTNDAVKNGMDKNVLITAIQSIDDQTLIQGLKDQWAYNTFYVTPNSLVVSVGVAHAIGDYALIELPGQYTK